MGMIISSHYVKYKFFCIFNVNGNGRIFITPLRYTSSIPNVIFKGLMRSLSTEDGFFLFSLLLCPTIGQRHRLSPFTTHSLGQCQTSHLYSLQSYNYESTWVTDMSNAVIFQLGRLLKRRFWVSSSTDGLRYFGTFM